MNDNQPPKEAKPLSVAVMARLNLAKDIYNLVIEMHPVGTYTPDLRNTLFLALVGLVPEHFGAIIFLVERRQFFGSAFALLRPLIETYLRGVWTQSIASESDLTAVGRGEKDFLGFSKCRAAVELHFAQNGVAGMYDMGADLIRSLHGFTHSGLEQIVSRIDSSRVVTPYNYPDVNIMNLLDQAGRFTVMAAMISVQAIEGSATEMSPKVEVLQVRFNQLLRSYGA